MRTTPRTHEEMMRRPTAWEIVIVDGDHRERIGFSSRKSKNNLVNAIRANSEKIVNLLTDEELDQEWTYSNDLGICFGGHVFVRYGQTERTIATLEGN